MSVVTITLPGGLKIEGTLEQVISTSRQLGYSVEKVLDPKLFYVSESKGVVAIKDMDTTHLRNAILKKYTQWVDSLHEIYEPASLVRKLIMGITDENWIAMVNEYSKRPTPTKK